MSRMSSSGAIVVKPGNNVYTGLAFISMIVTLGALVYVIMQSKDLGLM